LLGFVTLPLYVVGAITTEGLARWVMMGIGLLMGAAPFLPPLGRHAAPISLASAVTIMGLFSWLAGGPPHLVAASLAAQVIYTALMMPRRWAETGLILLPAIYALQPLVHDLAPMAALQGAAVALTNAAVGALLFHIRITTERRATEHNTALAEVNCRLEELNRSDPLTGLANRRTLDETLTGAWADGRINGRPVSFIMIDIDHFKRYNDQYGHLAGDACLRLIASTLADSVRGSDVVVRYGGEEFGIVLPGANLVTAYELAERVKSAVVDLRHEHAASPDGYLSISVGVASAVPGKYSPEELISAADRALYGAKHHGRNRVYV
jgi:diguanylate cyclase (GGDEF)-like protein